MKAGAVPTSVGRNPTARWIVLGLLVAVTLACLGTAAWLVQTRGAGDSPLDRLDSLQDGPEQDPALERQEILAAAEEFWTRFHTYDPDMLDDSGQLPDYRAIAADLMTAKFGDVFLECVAPAESTVSQVGAFRAGDAQAVGIAFADLDSAEVLVGGEVELGYWLGGKEDQKVSEQVAVRGKVTLIKHEGRWQVDDYDDIDDSTGGFAAGCGEVTGGGATPAPSEDSGGSGTTAPEPSQRATGGKKK